MVRKRPPSSRPLKVFTLAISLSVFLAGCKTYTPISTEFRTTPLVVAFDGSTVRVPYAADTSYRYVDQTTLSAAQKQQPAGTLVAWSRYLTNRQGDDPSHTVLKEYRLAELAFLSAARIPVIPLYMPRQRDLTGTQAMGLAAAKEAASIVEVATAPRGQLIKVMVFLDVEAYSPVSQDYMGRRRACSTTSICGGPTAWRYVRRITVWESK